MTIKQAKQLDIVQYLEQNNIRPVKISGLQYWYCSPFRVEHTPSFKVNSKLNLWFDFGENKGGNFIDLGIRILNCTVKEFLSSLDAQCYSVQSPFPFGPPNNPRKVEQHIHILSVHPISAHKLVNFLDKRKIDLTIADKYLLEARYQNGDSIYNALGFKNDLGGYELRCPFFKGSSSPKCVTFIDNNADELSVFEGCFDFLSYLCFARQNNGRNESFLILNSASFFDKQLTFMQEFSSVNLFLDNDNTGSSKTALALSLDSTKFIDRRGLFKGFKDVNEWWTTHTTT